MTTITIDRALLEQALDYIVTTNKSSQFWLVPHSNLNKTVSALRAALAQEPQTTHSADCWRWHHACAVAMIERERLGRRDPLFVGRRSALEKDK